MYLSLRTKHKTSAGFAQPLLMLALVGFTTVVAFLLYKTYKEQPYETSEMYVEAAVPSINTPAN